MDLFESNNPVFFLYDDLRRHYIPVGPRAMTDEERAASEAQFVKDRCPHLKWISRAEAREVPKRKVYTIKR